MKLGKFLPAATAAIMIAAAVPAFGATTTVCPVDGCGLGYEHYHDGCLYSGHYVGDGHEHQSYCGTNGCTQTGEHNHARSGRHHGGRHCR